MFFLIKSDAWFSGSSLAGNGGTANERARYCMELQLGKVIPEYSRKQYIITFYIPYYILYNAYLISDIAGREFAKI